MKEVKQGTGNIKIKVGEVFKYIAYNDRQYTLIALSSPHNACKGCVFRESGHPLCGYNCLSVSLECSNKIFKQADTILEDL